jgi:hypothetical protein
MLKMIPGFVLGSPTSSMYPKGTPAASLDDHFEHPSAKTSLI